MLRTLRRARELKETARRLCVALIGQSRDPVFFTRFGVPDTMDGRFDLVVLHAWLTLEWLESHPALAQALINEIFLQFDETLRQLGTSDVGMNRRLKTMASAFYGRLHAYRTASSREELAQAIERNLYRGRLERQVEAEALATYSLRFRSHLAGLDSPKAGLEFLPMPNM